MDMIKCRFCNGVMHNNNYCCKTSFHQLITDEPWTLPNSDVVHDKICPRCYINQHEVLEFFSEHGMSLKTLLITPTNT
eukprot:1349580-Karenia_brevis.AAC.1